MKGHKSHQKSTCCI